jgi:hypothetical protein
MPPTTAGKKQQSKKQKEVPMKISQVVSRPVAAIVAVITLTLSGQTHLRAQQLQPANLSGTVSMELIGQAHVLSPQAAIQYGYLSRAPGLDTLFNGTPENETTAMFTFYNDTATTRVINNGSLRIANREGTATFYFNPDAGATFTNAASFQAGTPIMTASLTHQVILDTVQNTFITQFSLTITSVSNFVLNGQTQRLGTVGQKMTWVVYGRPSTGTPTFDIAGFALSN